MRYALNAHVRVITKNRKGARVGNNWKIGHHHDTVSFYSDRYSDLFKAMKKAHHYSLWSRTIKFLRSRGWSIGENQSIKERYSCLSHYHKLGIKGDVRCLMEITGRGIEIKFGNVLNLWTGSAQSFWEDQTDNRHTKLSYLQYKAVDLEKSKTTSFFKSIGGVLKINERDLPPVERILKTLRINDHFHGKVNCLEDIKTDMENHPDRFYSYNNKDRNGKRVKCGEIKYFYPYPHYRLSCGEVWHSANSSWYVLHGKGMSCMQSHDLFDFDTTLTRRQKKAIGLTNVMNQHVNKGDFLKAHKIQQLILKEETA